MPEDASAPCRDAQREPGQTAAAAIIAPRIERLGARRAGELRDLLLGLDRSSRVCRFSCAVSDAYLIQYSWRAVMTADWIAGAFVEDALRGVVEIYDGGGGFCEAAFLVAAGWRRRGIGSALLAAATQWAAGSDRTVLRMVFPRGNWPMRRLAASAGARFDLDVDDISADIAVGDLRQAHMPGCPAGQGPREPLVTRPAQGTAGTRSSRRA
jgi:GNAT superfamily N-acetyltransferase